MERQEGVRSKPIQEYPVQKYTKTSHKPEIDAIEHRIQELVNKQKLLKSDLDDIKHSAVGCGPFRTGTKKIKKIDSEVRKVEKELEQERTNLQVAKDREKAEAKALKEESSLIAETIQKYAAHMRDGSRAEALSESTKALQMARNLKDLNVKDNDGSTLLHLACSANMKDLVEFLIASHVDQNTNNDGETPLMVACKADNFNLVELLLDSAGGEVPKDKDGDTPLHILLNATVEDEEARFALCEKLINKYPDIASMKNKHGSTPLMYALRNHDGRSVELLLQQPALEVYQKIISDIDNNDTTKLSEYLEKQPPLTNQEIDELLGVLKLQLQKKETTTRRVDAH